MKQLLLIRHAKATHHNDKNDFERALTPSGVEDATVMAQRLLAQNIIPQVIISSPALRAETTANIFAEHLSLHKLPTEIRIYEAKKDELLKVIAGLPDKYEFIALAGHNPDISDAIDRLTGEYKNVSTCAVALIEFHADNWQEVTAGTGTLLFYDEP
jgi:phosphohistidine phosphatase